MNFEFSDEQEMLRSQARRFLEERSSPRAVRAVLEGEQAYDHGSGGRSHSLSPGATTVESYCRPHGIRRLLGKLVLRIRVTNDKLARCTPGRSRPQDQEIQRNNSPE